MNCSINSDCTEPFPITVLLQLYQKHYKSNLLYCCHYRYLQLLIDWLGPISKSRYDANTNVPKVLISHEVAALARLTNNTEDQIFQELLDIWIQSQSESQTQE